MQNVLLPLNFNRSFASISYRFTVTASYLSKVAHFNLPHQDHLH